jgi:cell division protein FtsQ
MRAKGLNSAGQFWWRATEPIPARPERLELVADLDRATLTSPPPEHPLQPVVSSVAKPSLEQSSNHERPTVASDLGRYRPSVEYGAEYGPPSRAKGAPHQAAVFERVSGVEGVYGPIPPGTRMPLIRRHHALVAAGFAGALLFAAATGFGSNVRHVESLSGELDGLLVALGLGINEISLTGHRHTLDQDVFRALRAGRATLLTLDFEAARSRVEALPWIESATLVRIFPDKLRVELRERHPAAVWHDGERTALVDAEGRVLSYVAASELPAGLPQIAGPGAPVAALELRDALARYPAIASRVRLARRIGERRWDLELKTGARVKLAAGPTAPSLERMTRLERETRGLDHAKQIVDLTVARSIAVSTPVSLRGSQRASARETPARPL